MTQKVFNAPGEDPEEPHVSQDVQESTVDEHRSEHSDRAQLVRNNAISSYEVIHWPAVKAQTELIQKHQYVCDDQQKGNGRGRVVALGGPQRNHVPTPVPVLVSAVTC